MVREITHMDKVLLVQGDPDREDLDGDFHIDRHLMNARDRHNVCSLIGLGECRQLFSLKTICTQHATQRLQRKRTLIFRDPCPPSP